MNRTRHLMAFVSTMILLIGLIAPVRAIQPPHDVSNSIGCRDCHVAHPGGTALVRRDLAQDTLCKSCHNPTGQASTMPNVAMHIVDGGATTVDCGSCHDPHGPQTTTDTHTGGNTADNLSLVRGNIAKYRPGAVEPAIFQTRPDHFAFDTAPYSGACNACHTTTTYHRNNASGDHAHNYGSDCTSCHQHVNGFAPQRCVDCHNTAQDNGDGIPVGGRRAVLGEFAVGTTHQHLGNPASIQDSDCLACHNLGLHQSGTIRLVDPDNGATFYDFVQWTDLASDPDVSTFCMNCHDANGATRLGASALTPFGNGNTPPDMKSRFQGTLQWREWYGGDGCFFDEGTMRPVNSHHDISNADQAFSGAKLECLNCHSAHASADTQKIANPDSPLTPWAGTVSGFCLACHDGGTGPTAPGMPTGVTAPQVAVDLSGTPCDAPGDTCGSGQTTVAALRPMASCAYTGMPWNVEYQYANEPHGADSKRGWNGYSGAPSHDMACTVCHDPHGSYTATNTAGNPYMIRDVVDGLALEDDGSRYDPAGWLVGVFGQSRSVVVGVTPGASPPPAGSDPATVNWGGAASLCSSCHSRWNTGDWWHSTCTACQTCHNHGAGWNGADWVDFNSDSPCP